MMDKPIPEPDDLTAVWLAAKAEDADKLAKWQARFDLYWRAEQRAIKQWHEAHPGQNMNWPDKTKMTIWLLERDEARDATIAALRAEVEELNRRAPAHSDLTRLVEAARAMTECDLGLVPDEGCTCTACEAWHALRDALAPFGNMK